MRDSTTNSPLKCCSRRDACVHPDGPWLPATNDYFGPKKGTRDGLRTICKHCHSKDTRDRYAANPESRKAYTKQWQRDNPDLHNQYRRKVYHDERKAERAIERREKYHRNNGKEKLREQRAKKPWLYRLFWNRRMARKQALPDTLTAQEWQATLHDWGYRCAVCGAAENITADHWIPLSSPDCPGTTKNNMIPLCGSCNYSKQKHDPLEWMTWRFGREYALEQFETITAYLSWF